MNTDSIWVLIIGAAALAGLSLKWTLPPGKSGLLIGAATLVGIGVAWLLQAAGRHDAIALFAVVCCQGATYLALLAWLFYRDPERNSPQDPGLILSPADGQVIYIRKIAPAHVPVAEKKGRLLMLTELEQSRLGTSELWQVGIAMVFTDVHVNRAPIAGKVTLLKHRPGKFLSLRDADAAGVNERQTLVIEGSGIQVGLVQIASRLVRRIVAYVREGDAVVAGERIGMIKFGSQVDLFVPCSQCVKVEVAVGERTRAGVTVVGRLR